MGGKNQSGSLRPRPPPPPINLGALEGRYHTEKVDDSSDSSLYCCVSSDYLPPVRESTSIYSIDSNIINNILDKTKAQTQTSERKPQLTYPETTEVIEHVIKKEWDAAVADTTQQSNNEINTFEKAPLNDVKEKPTITRKKPSPVIERAIPERSSLTSEHEEGDHNNIQKGCVEQETFDFAPASVSKKEYAAANTKVRFDQEKQMKDADVVTRALPKNIAVGEVNTNKNFAASDLDTKEALKPNTANRRNKMDGSVNAGKHQDSSTVKVDTTNVTSPLAPKDVAMSPKPFMKKELSDAKKSGKEDHLPPLKSRDAQKELKSRNATSHTAPMDVALSNKTNGHNDESGVRKFDPVDGISSPNVRDLQKEVKKQQHHV